MDFNLRGKTALVTGGSRGIGFETARALLAQGAKVIICSRKQEGLDKAASALESPETLLALKAHVGNPEEVDRLFDTIEKETGPIDILVNNVGMNLVTPGVADLDPGVWQKIIDTNLTGTFLVSRKAAGMMRSKGRGKIVSISSIAGRKATPGMGIYGIAKAGIEMLTRVLASELAMFNIQVNAVAPAMVRTQFSKPFWSNTELAAHVTAAIPMGRIAEIEDVVRPVLFLASDGASFITGQTVMVDGGGHSRMIYAGIDIGSITAKAALIRQNPHDHALSLVGTRIIATGYNPVSAGEKVFSALMDKTGINRDEVDRILATGYGRNSVEFAHKAMTEIICHGAGAHFSNPGIRGVIDVGGQDSKAIALDESGRVENFAMNDKCAAGTGRFLEVMANALELDLDQLGPMGLTAEAPAKISSICTVFAESEVISMIAARETRANIIAGIHDSAAARVAGLANKIKIKSPVIMTGGVAKNTGLVKAIENRMGCKIMVGKFPQENGAIGAAVLAAGDRD